jgi:hypothetical protein
MSVKHLLLITILMAFSASLRGQAELSSYFLKDVGASQYLNPASSQQAKFSWYLPNGYYIMGTEGPSILGILQTSVLNLENLTRKINKNNSMVYGMQSSLGGLHFNYNFINFHIGQNLRFETQVDFNRNLFDMLLEGNAPYIGQNVEIGPYANLLLYNEFFLGVGTKLQNLQIGARIKRLNGLANFETAKNSFSIYTSEEIYQLDFNTEYRIQTNMIYDSLKFSLNPGGTLFNNFRNGGWALDFGLRADILEQFTLTASLLDMGMINWSNNTTTILTEGEYEFKGFDLVELVTDSLEVIRLDSLSRIIEVTRSNDNYRSGLPVKFYLGLQYYPVEEWEVNALFYNTFSSGRSQPTLRLGATYKPSEFFHAGFAYTWNRYAWVNLGLSLEAHLQWFHAFIAMDNIFDLFRPVFGNYFNTRIGVQIDLMK